MGDLPVGTGTLYRFATEDGETAAKLEPLTGWRYDQIVTSSAFGLTSARDATTEEIQTRLRKAYERHREKAGETEEFTKALAELESRSVTAAQDEMDRQNRLRLANELEAVKKLLERNRT
ncbi:MAG: hypothetical protein FJW34_16930 [Acidobacteria bacterium]|nr:hypothetical protein [Acidobacteriota bacterium]